MNRHPTHYSGKTRPLKTPVIIDGRYNPYKLDNNYVSLVCNCHHDQFSIFVSGYPEVKCQCSRCGKEYLIYDVDYYPAACGYAPDKGVFEKWCSPSGKDSFQVIVGWLYPEEPEDAEDNNDLDWFILVVKDTETHEYIEVVNDETA